MRQFALACTVLTASAIAAADDVGFAESQSIPDLSSFGLSGELPDMEGKVVLLDFWASWCAPCKASFPSMDEMYLKYKAKGFEIIAISVDTNEKLMHKFAKRLDIGFPVAHDGTKALVKTAKVESMPTSYLIDRKGIIRHAHRGWHGKRSAQALEKEIELLLEESI